MPILNIESRWSARQVLYSRCPHCGYILPWRAASIEGLKFQAWCCDLIFAAVVLENDPPWFQVLYSEVCLDNVVPLKG